MNGLGISLVQTSLHWEDKKANLEMLQKKIAGIPDETRLIILPEMFSTGFSMDKERLAETMDGPTVEWMKKMSAEKMAVLTGSFMARDESGGGITRYYNRLVWMLPNGQHGFYDKRHLFAYGQEDQHFSSGKSRLVTQVNGWKVSLQICYDLRFPVWLRQSKIKGEEEQPEYDLLIVVANWPAPRSLAWRILLQARAIENQCYVIGVNRTGTDGRGLQYAGESMVIGPLGDIIRVMDGKEEIFSHDLDHFHLDEVRSKFPFWRDADGFLIQP
jgi:omega-amidase